MSSISVLISIVYCLPVRQYANSQKINVGYAKQFVNQDRCIADQQVMNAFRTAFDAFTVTLLKKAAQHGNYMVALSPHSVWITLAAITEGADEKTKKELFTLLNLPKNACSRQKFYQIAATRINFTENFGIFQERLIVFDEDLKINSEWLDSVQKHSLLHIISVPINHDPFKMMNIVKRFIVRNPQITLNSNAIILNSIKYNGLWKNAFDSAGIERSPFYGQSGEVIGTVDLMWLRRRVRMGYIASTNSKIVELPIGANGEYKLIFAMIVNNYPTLEPMISNMKNYTMLETIASLKDSEYPMNIAIPRFTMKSGIDMKKVLEELGVVNLWQDPSTTWNISTPPIQPVSYVHGTTVTLVSEGIHPPIYEDASFQRANEDEKYWDQFIADRPFMFTLVDSRTYTSLLVALYSEPTYSSGPR